MSDKIKILFVRPSLGYGGADRVTLNLLKGFDRKLYACDLALMKGEGEFVSDLPEDVRLIDLKAGSLWSMWRPLIKLIKSSDYHILYSTCGGASMPMMLATILSGFQGISVVSERNILFPPNKNRSKRKLMLWLKKRLYKRATWVTAVSRGVKLECQNILGLNSNKVLVVNNAIINQDLLSGMQEPVDHPFFKTFEKVILAVGRFDLQKDYDTLLKAFANIAHKRNVGLFILGKGPLENFYKDQVKSMGLEEYVCFAGFDKNPFRFMKASDVYVLSSRHEGMPGTLIQAMACGTACISTDCPTGPNELIEDEVNGFLIPVGDPEKLEKRLSDLLEHENVRREFETNAPLSVRRFSEEEGIDSYFNFL